MHLEQGHLTSVSRSGIRSPIWWACLVVLVVNDHLLKGRGIVPSWLTGKASDFAGLVVAPVLLCALGARGHPWRRLACFGLVVAPFSWMKLSANGAHALERASSSVGLSWRIWADPTDLAALAVLPLAWWLSEPYAGAAPRSSRGLRAPERLAALLGAAACLASSSTWTVYETRIYLVNSAHRAPELKLYRSSAPLACDVEPVEAVRAATFALDRCALAGPFRALPLDRDYREWAVGEGPDDSPLPPARACDAVVLRATGLPDTVVYWQGGTKDEVDEDVSLGETTGSSAVLLESLGAEWVLTPGSDSETWVHDGFLPEAPCVAPK
jgi:hypothetical protein